MRPYRTTRLTEGPDVGDIKREGRKSSVGFSINGTRIVRHTRGYSQAKQKKKVRRAMKRADRARLDRELSSE